ncbi:MAG: hypothetical protein ACRBFS_07990 [Aureispira sp.]
MFIPICLSLVGLVIFGLWYAVYKAIKAPKASPEAIKAWQNQIEEGEDQPSNNLEQGISKTDTTQIRLINRADAEAILVALRASCQEHFAHKTKHINAQKASDQLTTAYFNQCRATNKYMLQTKLQLLDTALEKIRNL